MKGIALGRMSLLRVALRRITLKRISLGGIDLLGRISIWRIRPLRELSRLSLKGWIFRIRLKRL